MQHFSEIPNYPPPYPEPPQFRRILEPVSVPFFLASSSARPAAALRDIVIPLGARTRGKVVERADGVRELEGEVLAVPRDEVVLREALEGLLGHLAPARVRTFSI